MRRLLFLQALAAWLAAAPRPGAFSRGCDVQRYRIGLRFGEAARSFHGSARITLLPLRDGFEACELDAETFRVTSVRDGQGELRFEQTPDRLTVHLRRPHRRQEKAVFTVACGARNVSVDPVKYGMMQGYDLGLSYKDESPDHPRLINTLSFPEGGSASVSFERPPRRQGGFGGHCRRAEGRSGDCQRQARFRHEHPGRHALPLGAGQAPFHLSVRAGGRPVREGGGHPAARCR